MKFKLTKIIEAEECTYEFLKDGKHLANHVWAIAKYKDGTCAIVHKLTNEIAKEFKEKQKIYDNTWLLTLLDDTQCIMYYTEDEIKVSKPFLSLIYVFERFVLIENMEGKRKLLHRYSVNAFSKEFDWFSGTTENYKILNVHEGIRGLTIIKKQGLEVLNFEFDDYIFDANIRDGVIVRIGNEDCFVRISDFKTSMRYPDISPYNEHRKPINFSYYVVITRVNQRKALLRVEDFRISDEFDDIKSINHEYALVTTNGKEEILRLSDYKMAKFD